jgi:hypothetical protein
MANWWSAGGARRLREAAAAIVRAGRGAGRRAGPRLAGRLRTSARRGLTAAPEYGVVLLAASVVAGLVVVLQQTLTGDSASRALWAAIAAASVPVLVILAGQFGALFRRIGGRDPARGHLVVLMTLALVLSGLGFLKDSWLPGVLARCYSPPRSQAMTVFVAAPDGVCYGLLDTAATGLLAPGSFGVNAVSGSLQRRILEQNRPLQPGDLTIVWLGSLSCRPSPADPVRCADGRDYPAERDQLRGLFLAQQQIARTTSHRLHVVLADASQDVTHVDDVARLLVDRRAALGSRLAVVGGGDSRDVTQRAINRLLDAGIPFIAPTLLADLGTPGQPFVQRPGYLQFSPPNAQYAHDVVQRISLSHPGGFRLTVFQLPAPSDQYTTSLVNDLLAEAARVPGQGTRVFARHLRSLDQLDASVCGSDRQGPPTVVFYADRWGTFDAFAHRLDDVCGYSAPQQVMAGSVSRFMASNGLRAGSNASWPLDYYVGGLPCTDLTDGALSALVPSLRPRGGAFRCDPGAATGTYCTLDAAESVSQPCTPDELGTFVAPAWDAALLADALLPVRDPPPPGGTGAAAYLTSLSVDRLRVSEGVATVRGGRLVAPVIPLRLMRVDHLADPSQRPYAAPGPPAAGPEATR